MTARRKSAHRWAARAEALAVALPAARLHAAPLAWAARQLGAKPMLVAFSGGADSLALLLWLWASFPDRRAGFVAVHFNHRLRGREADGDEAFCREVCAALKLKCRVGRWRRSAGAQGKVSEAQARRARHEFFARELDRFGARALWLAHQQDDIAESMLMRLARGSGTAGLAAPRPVQVMGDGRVHLRPFLSLKKAELVAALQAVGARWREDSSNAGEAFFRNRVRHAVMPGWGEAAGRDALAGAALSRERLQEDDDALEHWVDALAVLSGRKHPRLNVAALQGLPRAVVRRALHRWLLALTETVDLSRQGFDALLAIVEAGRPTRFSVGAGGFAVLAEGILCFRRR